MSVKLFVTDLDGTLLPTGQTVSPKNIKAVQNMVKAGVMFNIATGRMYQSAMPIAKSLGVDVPIITYNGALIKSVSGEIFHTEYLSPELIVEIVNFCEINKWHLQSYSNDNLYFIEHNETARKYENSIKVSGSAIGWDGMRKYIENVPKLLIISSGLSETEEIIKSLKTKFGNIINVTRSNDNYTEITCSTVSKAAAIMVLAKKFNIDISEVMAIGDSYNDLPMLKAAGHSVAMGNSADEVKAACEYVTGNCEEDGFAQAVYKYVLN